MAESVFIGWFGPIKFVSSGSAISFNASLLPAVDNTYDLGSASFQWRTGYFGTSLILADAGLVQFGTTTPPVLVREGASHLFDRNSTTAQRFSVANTYTSSTNYEAFSVDWQTQANNAIIGTRTPATGSGRNALFVSQGSSASAAYSMLALLTPTGSTPFAQLGLFDSTRTGVSSGTTGNWIEFGGGTSSATSGTVARVAITPTYNQSSGTAANTDLLINRTQTAVGSGRQMVLDGQVGSASIAGISRAGVVLYANTTATQGEVTAAESKAKAITGIANNTATDVFTVTVPNAAHSAMIEVALAGSLGAGGAIGASEASASIKYVYTVTRTAGLAAVVTASTAFGSAASAVAGATTATITSAATAMSGLNSATQTFTIQVTIASGGGSSTNHTCRATATIVNQNATGITLA